MTGGRFLVDSVSCAPHWVELLVQLLAKQKEQRSGNIKLLKIVRLVRMAKMIKLMRIGRTFSG